MKMDEVKTSVYLSKVSSVQMRWITDALWERVGSSRCCVSPSFYKLNCFDRQKVTEREIECSSEVCTSLVSAIQRHQAGLVRELEEKQAAVERRAEELLEQLEQEITELQTRSSELQHLELTQNPLHLLQVR